MEPTVFHVDDDPLVRRSVELLLRSVGTPLRSFGSVREFLEQWAGDVHGCLVSDMRMPGLSGMDLLRHLKARKIRLPVIFLTAHAEVRLAVAALKAGVFDFLEKPCGDQTLLNAVQRAIAEDARRRTIRAATEATAARLALLNPGENEVLELVLDGQTNKTIAAQLGISVKTVEARRTKIMEKLECDSMARMIARIVGYRYWSETLNEDVALEEEHP